MSAAHHHHRVPLTLVLPVQLGPATLDGTGPPVVQRILLGYKKRGFGAHKWNGFGGKLEPGETVEQAAMRELHEEAGLRATRLRYRGCNDFEFRGDPKILQVFVFDTDEFEGEPTESDEMRPQWFDVAEVPYDAMWVDDRHWLPLVLAGAGDGAAAPHFLGSYVFEGHERIVSMDLRPVPANVARAPLERVADVEANNAWPVPSSSHS